MDKLIDISKITVFDIETVGMSPTLAELEKTNPRLAALWIERSKWLKDRYKDNNGEMDANALWEQKAGLHPEYGKVICATFGTFDKDGSLKIKSFYGDNEMDFLPDVNKVLDNVVRLNMLLGGHTIERFDIPFLWKRMLANRIRPSIMINVWSKKPWELSFFDIAKFWSGGPWQEGFTSLDTMSAIFGIPSPKAVVHGSRVHELYWNDKGLESIKDYCEGDVRATMEVIKIISEI